MAGTTETANPVLVTCTRGGLVESVHRGAFAIARADGEIVSLLGDCVRPVFPRSAVKALQAIALVEEGAADAFNLSDRKLAVACASHSGQPIHVRTVQGFLAKCGLEESALACGAHWPSNEDAARALARAGETPRAVHNNCSGKHAGMLALARHLGVDTAGYETADHPVQQRIRAVMRDLTAAPLGQDVCAVDGCSVPTWALPLQALARAFARFGSGAEMSATRAQACARLRAACFAEPQLVAGTGRFCSEVMQRLKDQAFVKVGAEGVYCAAIPETGLGVAVKIDDGARRAAEAAISAIVSAVVPGADEALGPILDPSLENWRGIKVGTIGVTPTFTEALNRLRF